MSGIFDQITNYSPPTVISGGVEYKGTWDASANSPTLLNPPSSSTKGFYYVVNAAGTQFGISFAVGDWIISNGSAWEKVDLTDAVSSVFGRTGAIAASNGDYTASQITNVPSGNITSTTVQAALNELDTLATTAKDVLDAYVTNDESVAITKGQVVYAYSATGNRMSVKLANNSAESTSSKTLGVVLDASIAAGTTGYIRMVGVVDGLNLGTYTAGQTVYLSSTNGTFTSTKPSAPNHLVYVGVVARANNGNGQLYVRVQNGYELDEIHDVQITGTPTSGSLIIRDATNSLWKNARLTAGTNIAVTNADASVTLGVTGIIGSTNGGTGNGFTKFSGPATSEKTFTLPNSSATLLYEGGAIGATTPSTVSATTLSSTVADGSYATRIMGATGRLRFLPYLSGTAYIDAVNTAETAGIPLNLSGSSVVLGVTGTGNIATISSTGAAITGTLSASSDITASGATGNLIFTGATYGQVQSTVNDLYLTAVASGKKVYVQAAGTLVGTFSSTGLGIGTASPALNIDVNGSGAGLRVYGTGTNDTPQIQLRNVGQIWQFLVDGSDSNKFKLRTGGGTTVLSCDTGGSTFAGTASAIGGAAERFHVLGTTVSSQDFCIITGGNASANSAYALRCFSTSNSSVVGGISFSTSATSFNTSSDARLKDDIEDFTDSGRIIDALKPRRWKWKSDGSDGLGFVAQEEYSVDPILAKIGAVTVGDDGETIERQWQRSDQALVPILVAELKSLRARLAAAGIA